MHFRKVLTIAFLITTAFAGFGQVVLVKDGKPSGRIIISSKAGIEEIQAAKVLQDYLERMSGAVLPLMDDSIHPRKNDVLVGFVKQSILPGKAWADIAEDGVLIQTKDDRLFISGGGGKGVLYSTYTFLENYLGCRKYTTEPAMVPKRKTISVKNIDFKQEPAFTYRENFYRAGRDPEYQVWHKLDSHADPATSEWGYWVHTFGTLLDPKEYGESHPEYFSFYDGQRHPGTVPSWDGGGTQPEAQLCLSNPEVLEIVCNNLKVAMDKNPTAKYWSVSQNDNVHYCQCEKCAAIDKEYAAFSPEEKTYSTHGGSHYTALGSGSIINFVNKVAARFPDKIISTLAYQYSRVPPKGIIPSPNVNIMLCSIESPRNSSLEVGDTAFSNDLKGWGKLTNNIIIWDYVIRFSNLFAPFPNLRTLQPNLQFMHENGVSAVFEQGNREIGGEMAELRSYLIDKLLWNPDVNVDSIMNDFLNGYYGKAAPFIKKYIDLIHDENLSATGYKMSIFGKPVQEKDSFLSDSLTARYTQIFEDAKKVVAEDPVLLDRMRTAQLPLQYAVLEIAKADSTGERGAFKSDQDGNSSPRREIVQTLYDFVYQCVKHDVTRVTEWRLTPLEYLGEYLKYLRRQ